MEVSNLLDMKTYFEDRMARFEEELRNKSSSTNGSLSEEFSIFKTFVLNTLKSFSNELEVLARQVDNVEMRSRRKMLLLHGVEEQADENTAQVVTELITQQLKLQTFTSGDIRRCHRMGRQSSSQKPRPIIVKFQDTSLRDNIWYTKSKLKGSGVTLSEFLTRSRHNAFMAAREKFGITKCWTREGCVYVVAPDGNHHRITSLGDLKKIKCIDIETPAPAVKPTGGRSKRTASAAKK